MHQRGAVLHHFDAFMHQGSAVLHQSDALMHQYYAVMHRYGAFMPIFDALLHIFGANVFFIKSFQGNNSNPPRNLNSLLFLLPVYYMILNTFH